MGERCRSGSAPGDLIEVILGGVTWLLALVWPADMPLAQGSPGTGMRWTIGQDAIGATVVQAEPCLIMAHSPGEAVPMTAAHGAGTTGRRTR